jgi:Tol biopolymer transport system component
LDQNWSCSLSPDGESIVMTSGFGSTDYTIITRRLDGSPVTTLGPGDSWGFSPDGAWIAGMLFSSQDLLLYPTGAGTVRRLERGSIESYDSGAWFPDSRNLLVIGNEPSSRLRAYRQSIDGRAPVPVTPEGVFGSLSPRGDRVLARDSENVWQLYPIDGGTPSVAPGLLPSDQVTAWNPEGAAVYVHDRGDVPARLTRVSLTTGERTPSLVIGPEGEAGIVVIRIDEPVLDPSRPICYMYQRRLSTLFLAEEMQR